MRILFQLRLEELHCAEIAYENLPSNAALLR